MTVIAWDGTTLAADKRSVFNGYAETTTKIFRVKGDLVGFEGNNALGLALIEWYRLGCDPETFPNSDPESETQLLVIKKSKVFYIQSTPYLLPFEDKFAAIGSGRDFALAAMYLGCDAVKAVQVASALCTSCGNGVDTLTFKRGS